MLSKILIFSVFALSIFFQSSELVASQGVTLSQISFVGNERTESHILHRELGFGVNQSVSIEMLELAVQNIRATQIFSNVSYQLFDKQGGHELVISVVEKWTTIPIIKLSSGGGVSQLTLGVYDPNLFGNYLEGGFQYERLGDTNSAVAWFKDPRLFDTRDGLSVQYWKTAKLRTKYKQNVDKAIEKTGFLHSRDKFFLGYTHEFSSLVSAEFSYEYNRDEFSDELVSDNIKALNITAGLPADTTVSFLGAGLNFGEVLAGKQGKDGTKLDLSFRYGLVSTKDIDNFWEFNLDLQTFESISEKSSWAHRFMAGYTGTSLLQYWHYLGGLDRIRGFANDRFAGRYYWLSNLEYRQILIQKEDYVVQGTGFLDAATTAESFDALDRVVGASVGFGARLILPKIYRFVVRLDVAAPIKTEDDHYISVGLQQFF